MTALELADRLSRLLQDTLRRTEPPPALGQGPDPLLEGACRWEIPKDPAFGDLSNSVAFKLAARRKQPPQRLAEELAATVLSSCREAGLGPQGARVEARGGFLNVFLSLQALAGIVRTILAQGPR